MVRETVTGYPHITGWIFPQPFALRLTKKKTLSLRGILEFIMFITEGTLTPLHSEIIQIPI